MTTYLKHIFALVAVLLLAGCDLLGDLDFLPSKPDGGDDAPLTTSPERLSLVSPQSGIELEYGESVDVTFMVEAYSPVTGQYWACEDAAVVFETESGELSEGVAISDDKGMVSVTWSPTATRAATQSHTLYARIYSSDGAIIDEATFVVKTGDNRDRDILVKFYEDTGGDNWIDNTNWCSDLPLSEWYGVETNEEGRVVELRLDDNNLSGGGSLSGLDALEWLECFYNQLTRLDVSGCTSLEILHCYYNQLTTLDVSGCTSLEILHCYYNQLTTLDVSGHTALVELYCLYTDITTLDASGCTALVEISCGGSQLTTLDVSGCTALVEISCKGSTLTTLDASGCTALVEISCEGTQFTTLDVSGCTSLVSFRCIGKQLTTLNVSGCTALVEISCERNRLTTLDVSGCTALRDIYCVHNQLTTLDVSGLTALEELDCGINQLTTLDVSGCTALEYLNCSYNQLTTLDVSGFTTLEWLDCSYNQLTTLDVSGCTALWVLNCWSNRITREISGIFAEIDSFSYDRRYSYSYDYDDNCYHWTDNGVGWWWPGEPHSGPHR